MTLKKQIIKKIENLNDQNILKDVGKMLDLYVDMNEIIKLTPEQKKALKKSMDDVKKGRVYSHAQVNKEIQKWLND